MLGGGCDCGCDSGCERADRKGMKAARKSADSMELGGGPRIADAAWVDWDDYETETATDSATDSESASESESGKTADSWAGRQSAAGEGRGRRQSHSTTEQSRLDRLWKLSRKTRFQPDTYRFVAAVGH